MLLLNDRPLAELEAALADVAPPAAVRAVRRAVLSAGLDHVPARLPGVAATKLRAIAERTGVRRLEVVERLTSPRDGFRKYLFLGAGPEPFEAVRIPLLHRPGDEKYIVCVSSQAGCAMGCVFCATGRLGFQRHLETWEIVDQVVRIAQESEHPVRGVVFMGQGEPLLNYDRVMRAADLFSEPSGLAIGAKAITISTVGIIPGIRRFTAEGRRNRLIISLTSARTDRRRTLFPIEAAYPLDELMQAVRERHAVTRRRVTLAWTMLSGINTGRDEARALAELTRGLPVLIDLIDVNDATGRFTAPDDAERNAFRDALTAELGAPVQRRYSGGSDVHAACGMLAAVRATALA
jgi:23S rRNA (adenine2503-C2)-methyltransferase